MINRPTGGHDPRLFSGLIYESDFNTDYGDSRHMAARIAQDMRFDEACRKGIVLKERWDVKNYDRKRYKSENFKDEV